MNLTHEQQNIVNQVVDWYHKPAIKEDDYFMTLEGFAGTGKSTVVDFIIKNTTNRVVVSAPTHKAKKVIQNKTGCIGETLQALLGLRLDTDIENFNPNKPVFNVKADEKIKYYKFVIVDESSMANKPLVKLIKEKAIANKVKVLFVGDRYQLPPVKEKISSVFTMPNRVVLNKIIRQQDSNPNTKLIEISRIDVINGSDKLDKYINQIKRDMNLEEGWRSLNPKDFYSEILEYYYNSSFKIDSDYAKVIAYGNKAVGEINKYIKSKVTDYKEFITKGDVLMGYNNISYQVDAPPYFIPVISNSQDYVVETVELIDLPIEGTVFKGYKTRLLNEYFPLFILHPDSYNDFKREILARREYAIRNNKWTNYYRFKDKIHLMWNIYDPYDPKKLLVKKDIDYGYAITVHKSQGSTYNNVGAVLKDINTLGRDVNQFPIYRQEEKQLIRQLKYVALSRTSNINVVYE